MTGEQIGAIIGEAARRAAAYAAQMDTRQVAPGAEDLARLSLLDVPLQDEPLPPEQVIAELDEIGSPATVASTSGRYFGFVIGGSLPAALGANLLAGAWDQEAGQRVAAPAAAALEEICRKWLISLFGLPVDCGTGFVTGATMANFSALAAARHAVLAQAGWDVEAQGLSGAPPITLIAGDEVHASVLKAIGMLGLGRERVVRVPTDGHGRMRADRLPPISGPAILCTQAGNVNTGAFDPVGEICSALTAAGARHTWVHVDGAFGLWARATPSRAALAAGVELADSWATDAHKWLNVPYDSGIVFVRQADHLRAAMSVQAAYLIKGGGREPDEYVPEMSRRARGVEIWAALRSLGRQGLAEMIERNCRQAQRFAEGLRAAGYDVLNEVVLNQVLVSFGTAEQTRRVIQAVQQEGTCWAGGSQWQGHTAMRISVSSWRTTEEDVERSLAAILRIARELVTA